LDLQAFVNTTNCEHSIRVSEISGILAKYLGYSQKEALIIGQAAIYHDIGKCDIPPEILNKPGALTDQEYSIVKCHTQLGGERIAEALRVLSAASVISEHHHEKWDGTGYHGLAAGEIHPYARLVSVADVFDALASKRVYRDACSIGDVIGYITNLAGVQFDEAVVSVLLAHADEIAALYR